MSAPARRRFLAAEVIQTSAMDCGPAALKCLLDGHGLPASYGRLREACQTSVDGTSIDTLEELARTLGLDAEQITLPRENLLVPEAGALPAMAVVALPSGLTHFLVVWRTVGPWVQVMDPARGRRWMRASQLVRELYLHDNRVGAGDFRAWAESDGFRDPLAARLKKLGAPARLIDEALAEPGWRTIAALDAAVRGTEALLDRKALSRGRAAAALAALLEDARSAAAGESLLGDDLWLVRPAPPGPGDEGEMVIVRGAVALHVIGPSEEPPGALPEDLAAVLGGREPGPAAKLLELLRADGLWRWPPLVAGLLLASAGAVFETLLFRGFLDVGRRLPLAMQRATAALALITLVMAFFCVEWPVWRGLLGLGRRLELRLRRAFLEKIPRVGDRYFQSRTVSDMAERAHLVHWLRLLPGQGGMLLRALGELMVTTVGIIWLDPGSAPLALILAVSMVAIPLAFQPALVERDLRMRSHSAGLARFYLDALMGLTPIRAHAAERAILREHDDRLGEWARAAWESARSAVTTEGAQALVGFLLAAWLLVHYLVSAPGSGWALLLVYWALSLPVLGQEIGFLLAQYPQHRNSTLRLIEPLGAPETAVAASRGPVRRGGVEVRIEDVLVRAAGHQLLEVGELLIPAGSHLAVVGASGGGKSTLAGLLLGWHEPARGRVLVDGRPLDRGSLADLRRDTVWSDPGVYLWNRSLLDNLRYGAPGSGQAVGSAVEDAELDEVLGRLPAGLQTALGEGGSLLSGGEGQRVRFGRGVVRGAARLVVLDEAFRGLERPRRQAMVARARQRWSEATLLCITHDVADTVGFPRVLVVADGRIVEDDDPRRLAERADSRFRSLLDADRRVRERLAAGEWRQLIVQEGVVRER
jgi:ABC-type bacteriocin/lantibiotic exporter with double-glycine peptidase domain